MIKLGSRQFATYSIITDSDKNHSRCRTHWVVKHRIFKQLKYDQGKMYLWDGKIWRSHQLSNQGTKLSSLLGATLRHGGIPAVTQWEGHRDTVKTWPETFNLGLSAWEHEAYLQHGTLSQKWPGLSGLQTTSFFFVFKHHVGVQGSGTGLGDLSASVIPTLVFTTQLAPVSTHLFTSGLKTWAPFAKEKALFKGDLTSALLC